MKYRVTLNDSIDLLVVADSELEAVQKVKKIKDAMRIFDSDQLRKLAYDLAQAANYFDRANSAHSRELLSDKDKQKMSELFSIGTRTYDVLKKEVEALRKAVESGKSIGSDAFLSDTYRLLNDASANMYFKGDVKVAALGKKIDDLANQYKRLIDEATRRRPHDSVSVGDESESEKVRKAQEWVDYDIKHYGEVSEQTKKDIKAAGLSFDKWNNQVRDSVFHDINSYEWEKMLYAIRNKMPPNKQRAFDRFYKDYHDMQEGRIKVDPIFFTRLDREFDEAVVNESVDDLYEVMRMLGRKIGTSY